MPRVQRPVVNTITSAQEKMLCPEMLTVATMNNAPDELVMQPKNAEASPASLGWGSRHSAALLDMTTRNDVLKQNINSVNCHALISNKPDNRATPALEATRTKLASRIIIKMPSYGSSARLTI